MKRIKTVILLTLIITTACAFNATAQWRSENTSSHRAYYGVPPLDQKFKPKKNKKVKKLTRIQPAKGTRTDKAILRRRT